ncbi:hypothetical protein TIFTF001_026249 [Ficus carica]|uniref:Uncharacterized protein n=1 Tax=Ficus carica TaxID=3494 RepID=A0AA88DKV2_FICCA|nr:hypothetical protein TIFTF001_026249 [Ficus carica]
MPSQTRRHRDGIWVSAPLPAPPGGAVPDLGLDRVGSPLRRSATPVADDAHRRDARGGSGFRWSVAAGSRPTVAGLWKPTTEKRQTHSKWSDPPRVAGDACPHSPTLASRRAPSAASSRSAIATRAPTAIRPQIRTY